jgi:hypothetical protein
VGTKEGPALGNWPCERHGSASVNTGYYALRTA